MFAALPGVRRSDVTIQLLNNIDHAEMRVSPRAGAEFGDAINQALVFPTEFEELQREFPIVFRRREAGIQAYALLGLDKHENLFLSGDRWDSRYVPANNRRGPFSIGVPRASIGEAAGEPMIHVEVDDPRVGIGEGEGLPLFLPHGGNAPYLDHIAGVLRLAYTGSEGAPGVYGGFEEAGLFVPVTLSIDVSDELRYTVPDVLVIDREALAALNGEPLERLHGAGLVPLAVLAAASLGNVQQLIDRKRARLTEAR